MTPQEISNNTKYQAALERADAKGIGIVARYTDKAGAFLGCQVQGTEGKQYHVANENNRLTCDCPAASYGNYCMHRAIVTRAEMERAAIEAEKSVMGYDCERPRGETTAQFYERVAGVNPTNLTEADFSRYMAYEYLAGGERREAITLWQQQMRAFDPQIAAEMSQARYGDFSPYFRAMKRASQAEQQRVDAAFDALTAAQVAHERKCSTSGCYKEATHNCADCSEYHTFGDSGYWTEGAKYCNDCSEKCTHQTEPQYPDYDDSNPRRDELEVTMKGAPLTVLPDQQEIRDARIAKLEAAIIRWQECELTHIDYYQDMLANLEALKAGAPYKEVAFDMEEVMLSAGRVFGAIANNSAHAVKRHSPPKAEPLMQRNDTGPRLFRAPLVERVREVM